MTITIQQILKASILVLWFSVNLAALLGNENIYVNLTSILYANLLFLTYFILARSKHIVTVMYTFISLFFVLQRILVIFINPYNIADLGTGTFTLTASDMNSGMLFIVLCNLSVILLSLISPDVGHFDRSQIKLNRDILNIIRFYPFVYIFFSILGFFFAFKTGIGLSVKHGSYEFGLIYRIILMFTSLNILLFVGVLIFKENRTRYIIAIIVSLITDILASSRAGLLGPIFYLIVCYMLVHSYHIKVKYLTLGVMIFLVSIFLYYPGISIFRSLVIDADYSVSVTQLLNLLRSAFGQAEILNNLSYNLLSMSERLALLEWLAAFIHFGREVFSENINFHSMFVTFVNSFVPGELIEHNYIPIAQFINFVWRGWITEDQGELAGIYGFFYLYMGYIGGIIIFSLWFWFSCYFMQRYNLILSALFLCYFVIDFMLGGFLDGDIVKMLYSIFTLYLLRVMLKLNRSRHTKSVKVKLSA